MEKIKFSGFPEIGQYRDVIRKVTDRARYVGKDESGKAIYDHSKVLPVQKYTFTIKLHGCLDKETKVSLPNGELVDIQNIKKGDVILSYDTIKNEYTPKEVINTYKFDSDKEWVKLSFTDRSIICTIDHRFFTINRGYVCAMDLDDSDEFVFE